MATRKNIQWVSSAAAASTTKAKARSKAKARRGALSPLPREKDLVPYTPMSADESKLHDVYVDKFAAGVPFVLTYDAALFLPRDNKRQTCETLYWVGRHHARLADVVFKRNTLVLWVGVGHEQERLLRSGGVIDAVKHRFLVGDTVYYLGSLTMIRPLF